MEKDRGEQKKRSNSLKNWLKNPYNLGAIAILLFGAVIRLYYFSLTQDQPLWWDEADYLAYAKNLAGFPVEWVATSNHFSILSWIVAGFFYIGLSESTAKLLIEVVPSMLLVLITYLLVDLMYKDKKMALICSFLMATFWVVLFNSMRFHVGVPALLFAFLAIYVFWQGYEKKEKIFGRLSSNWAIPLTVFFFTLSYAFRRQFFLIALFILAYIFITKNWKNLLKDKQNWVGLALGILLFVLIEMLLFQGTVFEQAGAGVLAQQKDDPIAFSALKVFNGYFANTNSPLTSSLLYLFWIGLAIILVSLFLHFGYITSAKNPAPKADLFFFISIIFTLAFFIFIFKPIGSFGEPRWYFPLLLGAFVAISKATLFVSDKLKKQGKYTSLIVIIILIGFGGYYQLKHADAIVKSKIPTYTGIKDAGLYIKSISEEDAIVLTYPVPQTAYYAERRVYHPIDDFDKEPNLNLEGFLEVAKRSQADYFIISFSDPGQLDWMKKVYQTPEGGIVWEIPFMESTVNFATGSQEVKTSKTYGDTTFTLLNVKQDTFIYGIQIE